MPTSPLDQSLVHAGLLDELPIVTEATTSRVIVNNPLLRHVLFSMDTGQVLTEHSSSRAVIVQMLSGKLLFNVAGQDHTISAGDVIYLAPNERHALEALAPTQLALTLVVVPSAKDSGA
ncbi:MAG: cupin [Actinobacteria bacterium]|nr:MAG: cupin [Actinomycetota bacterium]